MRGLNPEEIVALLEIWGESPGACDPCECGDELGGKLASTESTFEGLVALGRVARWDCDSCGELGADEAWHYSVTDAGRLAYRLASVMRSERAT